MVVGAIDQETANARRAHFPEGDFLLAAFYGSAAGEGGHLKDEIMKEAANRGGPPIPAYSMFSDGIPIASGETANRGRSMAGNRECSKP
jgi:hypothetical protein